MLIIHGACASVAIWGHCVQKLLFAPCDIPYTACRAQSAESKSRQGVVMQQLDEQ
jgi:hypothetical protein